jgi:PBP1b-binding outer membrane lipoprotein LpoB
MYLRRRSLIILLLAFLIISCNNSKNTKTEFVTAPSDTTASQQVNSPVFMYGIPTDSFDLVSGHIKRNGFLSEILLKHGVSMQEIDQALKNSRSVFDVRKIRSGSNYIHRKGQIPGLRA